MRIWDWMRRFHASEEVARARVEWEKSGSPETVFKAFRLHLNSAKQRGIPFSMTFTEWWDFWRQDDRWERRQARGAYMARFEDVGPYAVGNVYCATPAENSRDAFPALSRAQTRIWAERKAAGLTAKHLVDRPHHPRCKSVITPAGAFPSAALAADHYGITHNAAQIRARTEVMGWRYA